MLSELGDIKKSEQNANDPNKPKSLKELAEILNAKGQRKTSSDQLYGLCAASNKE